MSEPTLHVVEPRGAVRAVALVLHGGSANSTMRTMPTGLAVLRMIPFANSLHRAGRRHGLAVARLRFVLRGWNGDAQSPVADVRWALARLAERFPGADVALVGHSMGGRAAVYAAGGASVRAVVGLAPWLEEGDPQAQLAGRRLLFAHGDRDRITSTRRSAAYARSVAALTRSASYVSVEGDKHAMLHRASVWHALTTGYVLSVMCDVPPEETVSGPATKVLAEVLAGRPALVV